MAEGFNVVLGDQILAGVDEFGAEFRFTQFAGWGSSASTISPTQKTRAPGAWRGAKPQLTPRVLAIGGLIMADDTDTVRDAFDRLCDAVSLDGNRFAVTEGSLTRWVTACRQDEVLQTWLTDTKLQWSAQLVALDPRKVTDDLTAQTGLPSVVGGLGFPFSFPFSFGTTIVTGTCSLTNPGNEVGRVVLRISGLDDAHPLVGPVVTHQGSTVLTFSSDITLGAGQWIDVDMENEQVLANGQSSRDNTVIDRGWSGFDPGVNVWAFAAQSGTGLLEILRATPSWK